MELSKPTASVTQQDMIWYDMICIWLIGTAGRYKSISLCTRLEFEKI